MPKLPKMIIFDYGHTLCFEPHHSTLKGEKAMWSHIISNPDNVTMHDANKFACQICDEYAPVRQMGFEIHEYQILNFVYDYLGIKFDLPNAEMEKIYWWGTSAGAIMPGADKILYYLKECNIRTAVASNICFSGDALKDRLNRLLPNNDFEFVLASSEYVFRKPNRYMFELALKKSRLTADEVWYCGDHPQKDVDGASGVGMFPVWYDNETEKPHNLTDRKPPVCEHIHIKDWLELKAILEDMK